MNYAVLQFSMYALTGKGLKVGQVSNASKEVSLKGDSDDKVDKGKLDYLE